MSFGHNIIDVRNYKYSTVLVELQSSLFCSVHVVLCTCPPNKVRQLHTVEDVPHFPNPASQLGLDRQNFTLTYMNLCLNHSFVI